jgi:hypothetical protein
MMRAPNMFVRLKFAPSTSKHLLYQQRHRTAPLEIASIATARSPARCSAEPKEKHTDPFLGHKTMPPASKPANRYARQPFSGPPNSAASQPANCYAERDVRYPANATGSEQFRRPATIYYVRLTENTDIPH